MSFQQCQHGYLALTCPSCKGRSAAPVAVAAPSQGRSARPHYSGAPLETRRFLADTWGEIMQRTVDRIERTQFQHGVTTGALVRKEMGE